MTGPAAHRGSVSFDRMADRYDDTRGGEARGAETARALLPHLPTRGLVLELGVGTALVAGALAATGRDVVGVDLSPRMLDHAARRIPGRVVVGDVERLPVADGCVAACVAVHVLHLVGDQRAVLAEVARVLQPGGRLLVVVVDDDDDGGSDVERLHRRVQIAVRGGAPHPGSPGVWVPLAAEAGLSVLAQLVAERNKEPVTPAAAADGIEARLWSALWDVPDRLWAEQVVPAVAELRALPDQQRPRVTRERRRVLVLRPGG